MVKYPNAASGIKKVFLAKIIGVIGVPLAFIPGIGALLLMTCKQGRPGVECKQDLPYCHGSVPCCGIYPDTEHSRCNYITDSRCCDYLCVCGISDLSLSERTVSQP